MALVLAKDDHGDPVVVAVETPLPPEYKAVDVEFKPGPSGKSSSPKKRRPGLFSVKGDNPAR